MSFSIMDNDMEIVGKLGDEPNEDDGLDAAGLKAVFDQAGKLCKAAINKLIGELGSAAAAASVGFTRSASVPADNVQDAIENVQQQITGVSQGAVPNNSISTEKLEDDAVTEDKLLDGAVTAEKIASSVFEWVELTNSTPIQPTSEKDYESNTLRFYYCSALKLIYVVGDVIFNVTTTDAPNAFIPLPKRRGVNGHVVLAANAHSYMGSSFRDKVYIDGRADIDLGNEMRVYLLGLTDAELNKKFSVYVSGFYICQEGS